MRHKKLYVATRRGQVKENYKEVRLEIYASKFMVWQAICSCGEKTEPSVTQGTINSEIYIKERMEKRVLSFVRKHWFGAALARFGNIILC